MTNAASFGQAYLSTIANLVNDLEALRVLNTRINSEAGLVAGYFASGGSRTDINAQDFTNAENALVQILFAYDSGSPIQKSFLFKML